jgi:hypothetical protein
MDRKYIDDHHIAARYLADQLSDGEREAFEAYYVDHPDVMQDLEAAARIKVGLVKLHEAGQLEPLLGRAARPSRVLQYSAAAAVLVAVIGLSLFSLRGPAPPTLLAASPAALANDQGIPPPVSRMLTLLAARGSGQEAEIALSATPVITELRLRTNFEHEPPSYRVTLSAIGQDGEATLLGEVRELPGTEEGYAHVFLASPRVAGTYSLVLSGEGEGDDAAAGESSTFLIKVR